MFYNAQVLKTSNVCVSVSATVTDLSELTLTDRYLVALSEHDDTRIGKTYNKVTRKWSDE